MSCEKPLQYLKPITCLEFHQESIFLYNELACWSRGMILASGAGGPGFNSRTSPRILPRTSELPAAKLADVDCKL